MPKITELYAYIAEDNGPDDEGVAAMSAWFRSTPMMLPLVGADRERIASMRSQAAAIARASGKRVTLCRFSVREELEVIEP